MLEEKGLRRHCIEKMNVLPQDYCREADRRISSVVFGLSKYRNTKTISCFVGMRAEIQIASLIEEALRTDKQVAVPCCAGKGVMHAHVIRSPAELCPGTMGILEPSTKAPMLSPEGLDLVLLPCVSASWSGERSGYGGGFYNHHLSKTKALRALLARECLLPDDIPREAYDQPVDIAITEAGIFRRTQSKSGSVS